MYGQLMWMVNTSFYHFNHQQYFHKSCLTVSYNNKTKWTILSLYQHSLPFVKGGYSGPSTAPCRAMLRWSYASGLRRRSCASWLSSVVSICSHDYPLYLCITIRGQYHLTIQVKFGCPTDWVVLRNRWPYAAWMLSPPRTVGRDADSVASSHSAPIRVQYCLYSESGLFWAI